VRLYYPGIGTPPGLGQAERYEPMSVGVIVTVTWLDGKEETYKGFDAFVSNRNNLVITQQMYSQEPKRVIPLDNVRSYTTEDGWHPGR
jgi:hypothetical protein